MKLRHILFTLLIIFLVGGFTYIALVDVSVEKETITKNIPNERFFDTP